MKKEEILSQISELDIFHKYIGQQVPLGKAIISPLRHEKVPSFNIYQSENGRIYFKDFSGERGDCFKFIQELHNCSFREALDIVVLDFSLNSAYGSSGPFNYGSKILSLGKQGKTIDIPCVVNRKRARLDVVKRAWDKSSQAFWRQYNIGSFVLANYNVYPIESLTMDKRIGGEFTIKWKNSDPMYCYDYGDNVKKIYRPYHENKTYKFLSNTRSKDIFGLTAFNNKQKVLVICAGQKDCLSLYSNAGIRGIALNSESAHLTKTQYLEILNHTERLMVCYDNDNTGRINSKKLKEEFGIESISLKNKKWIVKDISDLCSAQEGPKILNDIIMNL